MNLVVKIEACSPQNGDENGLRRQKLDFLGQNWRRERASSIYWSS
ncbi:hypothetical protein [Caldifermentibacillus hisashii]|nr:hypothetical protein [Caldifermentibacillus hisashii]